jgi:hypothetical protein
MCFSRIKIRTLIQILSFEFEFVRIFLIGLLKNVIAYYIILVLPQSLCFRFSHGAYVC